jgi:hypothetical protein
VNGYLTSSDPRPNFARCQHHGGHGRDSLAGRAPQTLANVPADKISGRSDCALNLKEKETTDGQMDTATAGVNC